MRQDAALHHGTILVNVDMDNWDAMRPLPTKLQAKGRKVRSRVENLSVRPSMTIPALQEARRPADTYGASERVHCRCACARAGR